MTEKYYQMLKFMGRSGFTEARAEEIYSLAWSLANNIRDIDLIADALACAFIDGLEVSNPNRVKRNRDFYISKINS